MDLLKPANQSFSVFRLVIGLAFSVGLIFVGYYIFTSTASDAVKIIISVPIVLAGAGFVLQNLLSLFLIVFMQKGKVGKRLKDIQTKIDEKE